MQAMTFDYRPVYILVADGIFYVYEAVSKCSILFEIKEGENFNHPSTICQTHGAGRNTCSISRIKI